MRATFRNDFPLATFVAKCLRNLTAQRASCLVRFKHGPFSKHRIDLGENRSLDRIGLVLRIEIEYGYFEYRR